jgi:alginate O-acetyltransferase complex protein AlgJ
MQALAGVRLQAGNEKLYIGNRHGGRRWLFFRPDVDSLLAPGFLEPQTLRNRERNGDAWNPPPQPDPRVAVLEFRDQLASRGTELLLLPVPGKASIQPDRLAAGSGALAPLRNPSFDRFVKEMENAGVRVFDPSKSLMDFSLASSSPETYLATDTHWTPDAMDRVARDAASVVVGMASLSPPLVHSHRETSESLSGIGDIARMMRMSEGYTPFPPETFLLRPVITATGEYWSPTRSAEILLLGDSFSNIYSLEAMGMGRSAGFTERLGLHLRRPLDTLVRNDCGAYATRQWLARELARGNDRLEGKKLVIWQFSERELVYGDWRRIPLLWGEKRPSSFYVPPTGTVADVEGMVESLTPIPRPGSVVYADYILVVHLSGLSGGDGRMPAGAEALVYAWGMRDNKLAEASRLRVGEKTRWRIVPWSDVEEKWGGIRRGKLEEESISLQEPCWGEWIP